MNKPPAKAQPARSAREAVGMQTGGPGTHVAQRAEAPKTVMEYLLSAEPEIRKALPKGLDAERMKRVALTAVRRSVEQARKTGGQSLADCTPASFAGALLTCAALGLEPDLNGEAYLVPYKGECTLIIGYQGYVQLFLRSALAVGLDASFVCENDDFFYRRGSDPVIIHKPLVRGDRGEIIGYYAVAKLSTGFTRALFLTPEEVRLIRGGKVGPNGNIADPQRWMETKTAVRQVMKLLPKSVQLQAALQADERSGTELLQDNMPKLAMAGPQVIPPGDGYEPDGDNEWDEPDTRQPLQDTPRGRSVVDAELPPDPTDMQQGTVGDFPVQRKTKARAEAIKDMLAKHGERSREALTVAMGGEQVPLANAPLDAIKAATALDLPPVQKPNVDPQAAPGQSRTRQPVTEERRQLAKAIVDKHGDTRSGLAITLAVGARIPFEYVTDDELQRALDLAAEYVEQEFERDAESEG